MLYAYRENITTISLCKSFRVRCKYMPRGRSNLDENQWASCVSQLCLYHCYSISADTAVCNAESLSELAGQQQMCRSLIHCK